MAKEFKDYDKKYAKLKGTGFTGTLVQAASMHWWPYGEDYTIASPQDIRYAVYEAPDHEEWQKFRVSLKGLNTMKKLWCLADRWENMPNDFAIVALETIRINNYIGALIRGGQLTTGFKVVR